MTGIETRSRVLIVVSLVLVSSSVLLFRRRQNASAATGGRISRPKTVWLAIAVLDWFLLSPILGFDRNVPASLRILLLSFGSLMWLRGIGELFMLYVTKNWRPPIGIAHDVLCIAVLASGLVWFRAELSGLATSLERWILAFVIFNLGSLLVEVYYARSFFGLVHGRTVGDDGTWFATDDEARFVRLNRTTTIFNSLHLMFLAPFLCGLLGVLP
ncbi:hypothetical protein HY251_13430 [bacterium]|nr:hypothetical protein [bacterium]